MLHLWKALTLRLLKTGWLSLLAILEELKDRPMKRPSEAGLANVLAKRVRGVDLNGGR